MSIPLRTSIIFISVLIMSCNNQATGDQSEKNQESTGINTRTILSGYEIIWGMDFLPGGDLIFTEKQGSLYRKSGETVTKISGFPEVLDENQGGLLDVRVHPGYSENGWIYASFSAPTDGGKGQLRLVRFKIANDQVSTLENIFSTDASNTWHGHYGSRIEFDGKNHLYLSIGEGGNTSYAGPNKKNNNAQDLKSPWGKIHRLMDDGSIPADNPVFEGNTGPTSVYSYGHRNPQGLAINPRTNELWITEHGPKGGDEINVVAKGANYGWPDYSLGVNYDGTPISKGHKAEGITEPVFSWTPSNGTCGIAFVTGGKFGEMEGDLLVCGLVTEKLHRVEIRDGKITEKDPLLNREGRVRDVAIAPDGSIYVSVENPGRIIQILTD